MLQPDQLMTISFEDWKLKYRERIAEVCGIKPECFAETLNMIADDECLKEQWTEGEDPHYQADQEMSYWSE